MSWAEAMKENAKVASQDRISTEANVLRSKTSTSFDPYEVWLTRVKQPGEQPASRATANAESEVRQHPD